MSTFLTRRWLKNLPIAVFVVGGGIAIAQSQTGEAVFPYVGYLEENGFAVTGERTVRVDLLDDISSDSPAVCGGIMNVFIDPWWQERDQEAVNAK